MDRNASQVYPGLSRRLARLRNTLGLTKQELADRAGLTFNTVNDIEKGVRAQPLEKTLQSLATALQVDYEYLATGRREPAEALISPSHTEPRLAGRRRVVLVIGVCALATTLALQARWEVVRPSSKVVCLAKVPGGGYGHPRFEDIDMDGSVEVVRATKDGHSWSIAEIEPVSDTQWSFVPGIDMRCEGATYLSVFAHDVQGGPGKELLTLCRDKKRSWIDVLDASTGRILSSVAIPPLTDPPMLEQIAAVTTAPTGGPAEVMLTALAKDRSAGNVRAVEMQSGRELWRHEFDQPVNALDVRRLSSGGASGVIVWSDGNRGNNGPVEVISLEADGDIRWRTSVGWGQLVISGCVLTDSSVGDDLVVVCVNDLDELRRGVPSRMLILDADTGARVDSLTYTEMVVRCPLARPNEAGDGWYVYCGTKHGMLRRYDVQSRHVRLESQIKLGHGWVWPLQFIPGESGQGQMVVATAEHASFIVDRELRVLLRREAEEGAPISPLTTFSDPMGRSYIAFLCHGSDLCIDRVVAWAGWPTRWWYLLVYLLVFMALLLSSRGRRRRVGNHSP